MSKLYYNGVLLPEIPIVEGYPYAWIRKNNGAGQYQLFLCKSKLYYSNNAVYTIGGEKGKWYNCSISNPTSWSYANETYNYWGTETARPCIWSNVDILSGSATATDIYFIHSYPSESACVQSAKLHDNSNNSITLSLSNVDLENKVFLILATRTSTQISGNWKTIKGETNKFKDGELSQWIEMYELLDTTENVNVTITKAVSSARCYAILCEFVGVTGVTYLNTITNENSGIVTIDGKKENETILYIANNITNYTPSCQYATPSLKKVDGFESISDNADRLSIFLSTKEEQPQNYTFHGNSPDNDNEQIVTIRFETSETITSKYLIRSNGSLYQVDGTQIDAELTAETFQNYGSEEAPASDVLKQFETFDVLKWSDDAESMPKIVVNMTAIPPVQALLFTADLSAECIDGIESITSDYEGNVFVQYATDESQTWSEQITLEEFAEIDTDTLWSKLGEYRKIHLKILLNDASSVFRKIQIKFKMKGE